MTRHPRFVLFVGSSCLWATAWPALADRQSSPSADVGLSFRKATVATDEDRRAKTEQASLRATLLSKFSDILETRDTARGLIVNVGDVLFETGRYDLRPPARERLARFAWIVLAHNGAQRAGRGFHRFERQGRRQRTAVATTGRCGRRVS